MKEIADTLERDMEKAGEAFYAPRVTLDCIRKWCADSKFVTADGTKVIRFSYNRSTYNDREREIYDNVCALFNNQPDQAKREAIVNTYLNQVGLQIIVDLTVSSFTVEVMES
mmetsp:Transcript_21991/g.33429  ORF Transcript_21991/g.33429 Transcript_21991/m.33429 type:complete len:112 (-) Transcript_21991:96-431(-)